MQITRSSGRRATARTRLLALVLPVALLAGALGAPPVAGAGGGAAHRVADGTVTGPIPSDVGLGVILLQAITDRLPAYDYVESEYFVEGTATAYQPVGTLGADGRWRVRPASTAPYKTRMVVRRPADPARFNGTVVVEWLNVTAGFDTSPDWNFGREELMRQGYAWVGVSAQSVGIDNPPLGLRAIDPVRYGSLAHPGDEYSYDIFTQVGAVVGRHGPGNPLGLRVRRVIADGESQSASRMTTYVNAFAPWTRVFDAYLIHSRSASASALGAGVTMPNPTFVRTDLADPVLVLESETDVPRYAPARQADSRRFRSWEVAGTSHVDLYALGPDTGGILGCTLPVNAGPHHYVFHTALRDLRRWMLRPGYSPPSSPLIELDAAGAVVRGADGNALGGIRTPQLDVPVATLSGAGNSPGLCVLFGTTTPFTDAEVLARYADRTDYLRRYLEAEWAALASGFVLPDDGFAMFAEAYAFPFPGA